uniref:RanBP2-type domain-containing protein n=1 Tax=Setaria digitata TaxID=48799 RepID=A0A915PGS0_9BILA
MSAKKRNRSKAEDEGFEPGSWECTVCTFRNRHEAFKCEMCDTRRMKFMSKVMPFQKGYIDKKATFESECSAASHGRAKLCCSAEPCRETEVVSLRDSLIIRSSAKKHIVTVKGVPACIIEYKKREDDKKLLERRTSPKQGCLKKDLSA